MNRVERFALIRERAKTDEDIAFLLAEVERSTNAMVDALNHIKRTDNVDAQ